MEKILFVCHGNICRSPMGEYILKDMAAKAGLSDRFEIASAAVSDEERGNPVYPPARDMMMRHGISCKGKRAQQMTRQDYAAFDYIVGMDQSNMRNMLRIAGGDPDNKMSLLMDHTARPGNVADPWYTGDFEATWRDVNEGCRALLRKW